MTAAIDAVLAEVGGRVAYLQATAPGAGVTDEPGWLPCDGIEDADLRQAVEAGRLRWSNRQVAASLLAQSYAFKVGAVSLAAYALGLAWPSPAAGSTAVVLAGGRATRLAFRSGAMGAPEDAEGLAGALLDAHLEPWSARLRATVRLGRRLVAGNVAASAAAAFRSVEGAARDRGDGAERAAVRRRAEAFFAAPTAQRHLGGAGRFETVHLQRPQPGPRRPEAMVDGWHWTRSSCCLWYQAAAGGRTCDDCSLIPAPDLERARLDELASSLAAAKEPTS